MGNAVFPTMPGVNWNVTKAPEFTTLVQTAASKRELRASLTAYPIYEISMSYEFLRQHGAFNELRELCGFFLARRGKFDSFLFTDPSDYSVTDEPFGTANGSATQFQLTRSFGGFAEPCENINTVSGINRNGSPVGISYTVGSTGIVTFASAPAAGALTWSGAYYLRCRFVQDSAEFSQFAKNLYELRKLQLIGAPGNKV